MEVELGRYMGMMPAIPVDGPSKVEFVYRPNFLYKGIGLVFLGLFLVICLVRAHPRLMNEK